MIQEIQLSNFKAFADAVKIPIKPITLIFGPNSSGKTSIFQSLLMLKQTLEESEKKDQVLLPKGKRVDLGSYRELIHNHDISQSFSATIRMSPFDLYDAIPESTGKEALDISEEFEKLRKSVETLSLGLTFTFSYEINAGIRVSKIDLLVGEETKPVLTYVNEPPEEPLTEDAKDDNDYWKKRKAQKIRRNWNLWNELPKCLLKIKQRNQQHPYWQKYVKDEIFVSAINEISVSAIMSGISKLPDEERRAATKLLKKLKIIASNKIPQNSQDLPSAFTNDCVTLQNFLPVELNDTPPYFLVWNDFQSEDMGNISIITLAVANTIADFLKQCIFHIGPVRQNPERYFTFSGVTTTYVGRSGEYLYDILIDNPSLVEAVNKQLSRLNIGYQLKIDTLSNEDSDISDLYSIRLMNADGVKIAMTDVGYGISQVLPVIMQCILSKEQTILIEQPELHLHPAQQAELGDQNNTFIIETHSEHLILRLLRRIRETAEGRLEPGCTPIKPDQISVLYVQPGSEGSNITELIVTNDGDFENHWPNGFFTERAKELF